MENNLSWSFFQVWNESLGGRAERELTPRQHAWAGEIGGAFLDRYLKMTAVTPTNPPNARSLRKFEAGNLMEWVVEMVLGRAGILVDKQKWLEFQYPGLIRVTGKLDHLAGGKIDWEKAKGVVQTMELPEFFGRATGKIVDYLSEKYPDGMKEIVIEVKSVSSFMFDRYEVLKKPNQQHALQLFHYLKALDLPEGHIIYICKDDLRMIEFGVFNPSPTEDLYKADIEKMTEFIRYKKQPAKELEVYFDEETGKFSKNWKVEYSGYLTMIYGYETPEAYREAWDKKISQYNGALKRVILSETGGTTPTGKPIVLTPGNLEGIKEIEKQFPNWRDFVVIGKELKKKGLLEEEENGQA